MKKKKILKYQLPNLCSNLKIDMQWITIKEFKKSIINLIFKSSPTTTYFQAILSAGLSI